MKSRDEVIEETAKQFHDLYFTRFRGAAGLREMKSDWDTFGTYHQEAVRHALSELEEKGVIAFVVQP